jgi:hypothetical protein
MIQIKNKNFKAGASNLAASKYHFTILSVGETYHIKLGITTCDYLE